MPPTFSEVRDRIRKLRRRIQRLRMEEATPPRRFDGAKRENGRAKADQSNRRQWN